ncbi:MAG: DotI/IcmL family type IV secretion protein [Candidatus Berkiella sp.]
MRRWFTLVSMACIMGISPAHAVTPPDAPPDIREMNKAIKALEKRMDQVEKDVYLIKSIGKYEDLPVTQPIAPADVLSWSTESTLEIYNYDYLNYQYILKKIKPLFTAAGYESYLKALEDSKNLELVKTKKLFVSAVPTGEPFISKEGMSEEGVYKWEVQMPLMVTYKNNTQIVQQQVNIAIDVVRTKLSESRAGIAIHSITANVTSTQAPPSEDAKSEAAAPAASPPSTGLVPPPSPSKP